MVLRQYIILDLSQPLFQFVPQEKTDLSLFSNLILRKRDWYGNPPDTGRIGRVNLPLGKQVNWPEIDDHTCQGWSRSFKIFFSPLTWALATRYREVGGLKRRLGWKKYRKWISAKRLYSSLSGSETTLCNTPHFQWIYGKLNQFYEKLRSDQMDLKSALGGPKPISRTGSSLLKNWSYISNQCIYFSILLYWRPHLAKTLFILHKYIKCALL